jgi:hypothetical protein
MLLSPQPTPEYHVGLKMVVVGEGHGKAFVGTISFLINLFIDSWQKSHIQ